MIGSVMERKIKAGAALLCILILLPYIMTIFIRGADETEIADTGAAYIQVAKKTEKGKEEVVTMSWTDYMTGILADEIPENFEPEAMKAQAVLIRTQLYRMAEETEDDVFTLNCLSREEMEKKWGIVDFVETYDKYIRAVTETDDYVLLYEDSYAWTPFHYSSCGRTRSAREVMGTDAYPYIAVRECPADKEADGEISAVTVSFEKVQECCRDFLVAVSDGEQAAEGFSYEDFEICERDESGYVRKLRIGSTYCSGDQFRDAMGLESSAFEFSQPETGEKENNSDSSDMLKITVTGKGHGLGMSLWTADAMAKEGAAWEEILEYFFDGTQISSEISEKDVLNH